MNSENITGDGGRALKALGAVVLSLEDEINDRNINDLEREVDRLSVVFQGDKVASTFVKIIGAVGRYMAAKGTAAHADAVPTLVSAHAALARIVLSPGMPAGEKRDLAAGELAKFNALKKLIGGEKPVVPPAPPGDAESIAPLKAVILSLEWEISDGTIRNLDNEITRLQSLWAGHKLHLAFLQIIRVVGKYVGAKKADAHADSITLLHSVFDALEAVVDAPGMPPGEQQELLDSRLREFNDLKGKIASAPSPSETIGQRSAAPKAPPVPDTDLSDPPSREIPPAFPLEPDEADASSDEQARTGQAPPSPALSHVAPPEGNGQDTLRAYEVKPLTEVNTRLDAFFDEVPDVPPSGPNPMDDLFGSHEVSPADELLQEIHLKVLGEGDGPADQESPSVTPPRDAGTPHVREFVPSRGEGAPLQEIDNRLDEFFDEDEPLSDSTFADDGEVVVPYRVEDEADPATGLDVDDSPAPALSGDLTGFSADGDREGGFPGVTPLAPVETEPAAPAPPAFETGVETTGFDPPGAGDAHSPEPFAPASEGISAGFDSPGTEGVTPLEPFAAEPDGIPPELDSSETDGVVPLEPFETDSYGVETEYDPLAADDTQPEDSSAYEGVSTEFGSLGSEGVAAEFDSLGTEGVAPLEPFMPESETMSSEFDPLGDGDDASRVSLETDKPISRDSEGISPFQFEDEFFDEETGAGESADQTSLIPEAAELEAEMPESELMERLRIGIRQLSKSVDKLTTEGIYKDIDALKSKWADEPRRLLNLKILNSLILYIGMMGTESKRESLELLYRAHENLEKVSTKEHSSDGEARLPDLFGEYIDLQDRIVRDMTFTLVRYRGELTPEQESRASRGQSPEENLGDGAEGTHDITSTFGMGESVLTDNNEDAPPKKGLLSKLMGIFGGGKT